MTGQYKEAVISLIAGKAQSFQPFAESFAKSRFLLYSVEFGQNEEEAAALQQIADGIQCRIASTDGGIDLTIDFDNGDRGEYLDVIEGGMDAPLTGGHGGIVTNPDGTTRPSLVPEPLWGNPIDEYAKAGSDVCEEVRMMLKDLFADRVREIVSECKPMIAQAARKEIVQEISRMLKK